MTKKFVLVAIIAAVATAGIIFGINALRYQYKKRYVWGEPEKRAEYIVNKLTKKLDLTKDQQEKVNKIKDEILARTKAIRNDRTVLREELASLIKSERLTKDMVNKFIDKRKSKMDEIRPFLVEKFIEFHNILTPEQRAKLSEKTERWFYHFRK
jgi:periplasmic protein CpxP/Spy